MTQTIYDNGSSITYNYDDTGNRTSVDTLEPPSFSVSDGTVVEGGSVRFTVLRSGSALQGDFVQFSTADITATAGSDYTAASGTLLFAPSGGGYIIQVQTADDSLQEGNETFSLNLSNSSPGASIADGQGIGTIEDNDGPTPVVFSINDVSVNEGGPLVFTVTKAGNDGLSHNVDYDANTGTTSIFDYTSTSGTLTFASSETTKTISVPTIDDTDEESDETVELDLDNPSTGATISDNQGIGTILDNDGANAPVQFSVNNVSVTEGGDLSFTVAKAGDDGQTHTVDYDSERGTAGIFDFTDVSGTLTFTSTQFSKTVLVPTDQDTKTESDETVILKLENPSSGSGISDDEGVGTILDDD